MHTYPPEDVHRATSENSTLELFGALMTCLARAIAFATPPQLDKYEAEVLELLQSVNPESASADAFRSVLLEIESCRRLSFPQ
mgnify:CR=1 FL=1